MAHAHTPRHGPISVLSWQKNVGLNLLQTIKEPGARTHKPLTSREIHLALHPLRGVARVPSAVVCVSRHDLQHRLQAARLRSGRGVVRVAQHQVGQQA